MADGWKDIYDNTGAVSKETVQDILSSDDSLKGLIQFFRVVACKDNGSNYGLVKKIIGDDPNLSPSARASPEQFIERMRNNPDAVLDYTNMMKAVGQSTSCEGLMSALPTPVNLASAKGAGRGHG